MHYRAFNLHFIIPFDCPELIALDPSESTYDRVRVSFNPLPNHLNHKTNEGPAFEANENELLLKVKNVAKYLIRNGNEIIIDKAPATDDASLRLFLFGSACGALLFQRKLLPIHASAIKTDRGAVLFAGDSGAGKSTTLQQFLRSGYEKLSDDITAVYYDEKAQKVYAVPSFPQSKIWQETADLIKTDTKDLRRIRPEIQKFALPTHRYFCNEPTPVHAIYILTVSQDAEISLQAVKNLERFFVIKQHTYRALFQKNMPHHDRRFQLVSQLASQSKMMYVGRPKGSETVRELCETIEKDFL